MNKHHDIGKIQFHGDFFEITIDGLLGIVSAPLRKRKIA